jgi:hypothetical protein
MYLGLWFLQISPQVYIGRIDNPPHRPAKIPIDLLAFLFVKSYVQCGLYMQNVIDLTTFSDKNHYFILLDNHILYQL